VVEFAYDYLGRRVRKVVNGVTNRFVYDGWNVVAEVRDQMSEVGTNYYVWGLDLSGSLQGAGGIRLRSRATAGQVGGLLATIRDGEGYFPCCDANGNVTGLVDTNGATVAHRWRITNMMRMGTSLRRPGRKLMILASCSPPNIRIGRPACTTTGIVITVHQWVAG